MKSRSIAMDDEQRISDTPFQTDKFRIILGKSWNKIGIPDNLQVEDKGNYYDVELEPKYMPEVLDTLSRKITQSNLSLFPDPFEFSCIREIPGSKEGRCPTCGKRY
jgi:hypothetical protein